MTDDSSNSTPQTAPPPHRWTVTHTRITIAIAALALVVGLLNYLKPNGSPSGQGINGGVGAGIINGTVIGTQNVGSGSTVTEADPGLFIECYQRVFTAHVPQDGRIYFIDLSNKDFDGVAVLTVTPGSDYPLPGAKPFGIRRCTVSNYGSKTRFNISINFHLRYLEAIHETPNAARSGKMLAERDLTIPIGKIDAGKDGQIDLYIKNSVDSFVAIDLRDIAIEDFGSDRQKKIKVTWPTYQGLVLDPA